MVERWSLQHGANGINHLRPNAAAAKAYSRDSVVANTPESSVHRTTGWPAGQAGSRGEAGGARWWQDTGQRRGRRSPIEACSYAQSSGSA